MIGFGAKVVVGYYQRGHYYPVDIKFERKLEWVMNSALNMTCLGYSKKE